MRGWGFIFSARRLVEEVVCRVIIFLFYFSCEYLAFVTLMSVNGDFQFNGLENHNNSKATFFLKLFFLQLWQLMSLMLIFFIPCSIFLFFTLKIFIIIYIFAYIIIHKIDYIYNNPQNNSVCKAALQLFWVVKIAIKNKCFCYLCLDFLPLPVKYENK